MYNRDVIAEWALFQTADHKGVVVDGSERRVHAGLVRNLVHASDNHPDNAFACSSCSAVVCSTQPRRGCIVSSD